MHQSVMYENVMHENAMYGNATHESVSKGTGGDDAVSPAHFLLGNIVSLTLGTLIFGGMIYTVL